MLSKYYNTIIDHGVRKPGHDREVVDGLNTTENKSCSKLWQLCSFQDQKHLISKWICNPKPIILMSVQHNNFKNIYLMYHVNMKLLMMENTKNGKVKKVVKQILSCEKYQDVAHRYVKTFCNTTQFPALPFFGPHIKPHGVCVLSKHYCMFLDTKLIHSTCGIC